MTREPPSNAARFHRLAAATGPVPFTIDGEPATGQAGDTLLSAVLSLRPALRRNIANGELRAGFCQIGACQDCWLRRNGIPVRACMTPLEPHDRVELPLDLPAQDGGGEM